MDIFIPKKVIALFVAILLVIILLGCATDPGTPRSAQGANPAAIQAATPTLGPGCYTPTPAPTATNTAIPPTSTVTNTPAPPTATATATNTPTPGAALRFAIIGDYGADTPEEAGVATLVKGWNPAFIATIGDNNYPDWTYGNPANSLAKYYGAYITSNPPRFFPVMGNHDYERDVSYGQIGDPSKYLAYFPYLAAMSPAAAPVKGTFYDYKNGPVHLFMLNSNWSEDGGVDPANDAQPMWLKGALASETGAWKLVLFHHSPYTSGTTDGPSTYMRWPFATWGANAVISGHEHNYERLLIGGLPYFVNGAGGNGLYSFGTPVSGSQKRYNADNGAMLVTATSTTIKFEFYNRAGALIDTYSLSKP